MKHLLLISLFLAGLWQSAWSCPFCNPGESDLFSDIQEAQAVVLVKKIEVRKYKVTATLLGPVKAGRMVVAAEPRGKLGKTGELLLTTAGPPNLPYWSDPPRVLSADELVFAKACLQMRQSSQSEQWDFAAKHLERPSSEITTAAYNLLAAAPLVEVQKRRTVVGQGNLVSWIQSLSVPAERKSLYLLMAYQQFKSADLQWLKPLLFRESNLSSPSQGPLVLSYVHLAGSPALDEVRKRFYGPGSPATQFLPINRALTLLGQQSQNPETKQGVRKFFGQELKTQRGPYVLAPLAVWQDYSGAEHVEGLFRQNASTTWIKVACIRYFRTFKSAQAKAALQRLANLDKNLVWTTIDPYRKSDLGID